LTIATVSFGEEAFPARDAAAVSSALSCCITAVVETPPPFWTPTQRINFAFFSFEGEEEVVRRKKWVGVLTILLYTLLMILPANPLSLRINFAFVSVRRSG
jgi:hypothetical protein